MVPEACMVSELPLDVHAHMLPRAGAINPVPPATLVSVGVGRMQSLTNTQMPTWMGGRKGTTDVTLCLCPKCCGIRPEGQQDVDNLRSGKDKGARSP